MATVTDPLFVLVMLSFAAGIVVGWVSNNVCRPASPTATPKQE